MVRFLVNEVFFIHIDLVIFQHTSFRYLTECFDLRSEPLILVDFFHKSGILLRLGGINRLWPATLSMEHAFIPCTDSHSVNLMHRKVSYIVKLNEVRISKDIILIFEMVFRRRVESCGDGSSICKCRRSSELPSSSCILIKLCHDIYIT